MSSQGGRAGGIMSRMKGSAAQDAAESSRSPSPPHTSHEPGACTGAACRLTCRLAQAQQADEDVLARVLVR